MSIKGKLVKVQRTILAPEVCKPKVPVSIMPAPTVQYFTAPAPDLALTSLITALTEHNLPHSIKHYWKRKLEAK
ncbi:hypothetical protein DPMN_160588 [Dreissena polymorpha]|uniref:Uncharacterized protein n=1 Tax=Dreissena polymorpha TaxID=45954 RepID=A0A9D4ENF4_DREPO|nr:hypothetical protein DPMN_160588 [Dreissena polymorpha]